jgi:hypothetical protein
VSRSSLESHQTVQNLSSVTWLLPTATIAFVAYLVFAIGGGVALDFPIWLVVIPSLPAVMLLCLALIVALVDASRRPRSQMSEEVRIVWILALCLLNVFALLPYWLLVIRRNPQPIA